MQVRIYMINALQLSLTYVMIAPYIKVLDYVDQSVPLDERGDLLIFMSGINEVSVKQIYLRGTYMSN